MPQVRRALLALALILLASLARAAETGEVVRTVDGDTLVVRIGVVEERVRLIGVDTPETKDPRRPVQYFGREASRFTAALADGKSVRLERDPVVADRDRYGRLLRYVYLPDGTCLNERIVSGGYGHAYLKYPFSRSDRFVEPQRAAREAGRGLWGGEPDVAPAIAAGDDVYVTLHGSRYHRATCRHVSAGAIRIPLADALLTHAPCAVCKP